MLFVSINESFYRNELKRLPSLFSTLANFNRNFKSAILDIPQMEFQSLTRLLLAAAAMCVICVCVDGLQTISTIFWYSSVGE